jgi:hypothetical protein
MKRLAALLFAALFALQSAAGPFAISGSSATDATLSTSDITTNNVSTTQHGFAPKAPNSTQQFLRGDAAWAVANLPSAAFASLPACASNNGAVYRATDVGEAPGALLVCNGTRWKPLNGRVRLKTLGAAVTGLTNTEAISLQASLPSGLMAANDQIEIWTTGTKSGSTDTGSISIRMGTAGTTADAQILTQLIMSATGLTYGAPLVFKFTTTTAAQRVGTATQISTSAGAYAGGATTAFPASVAISDITANALFISVALTSAGATNTLGLYTGWIDWIAP